ncbi:MAG: SdpI family protein, partial [Chloracidobacterium sp.]|nr:SdpI family protein [Chloracidobacterium sp.]
MNEAFVDYFIAGLALFAAGVPLLRGWIPRNRWSGFRVPKTLSSDEIWYEANRVAGRNLMIAGAAVMAAMIIGALFARQIPGLPFEK